jgi:dihydroorotate dehydrogenase
MFDPERVHHFSMNSLRFLCSIPFVKKIITSKFSTSSNQLERKLLGLTFKNPVGLGAGFDKNAKYLHELEALGFGFVEIGTVTPKPQDGNEKPRVFRLPKDKALINRMGFNNEGVEAIAARLKEWQERGGQTNENRRMLIGGNIGKNKATANEDAWKDYEICFKTLHPYVDYFVVNVSSPNTPGLRELQDKDALRKILTNLQQLNIAFSQPKPVLLKIAPDLTLSQIDDVIDLAIEIKLDGLVATNTTISREGLLTDEKLVQAMGAGGLSGLPVRKRSTEIVEYLHKKTNGSIPIMASGGVFTGPDALEKLNSGAAVVQVWTGFIYEGPGIVKNICSFLARQERT